MAVLKATDQRAIFKAWARLRLDDGKQIMLSLSENGLIVFRMVLGGSLPIWSVWSCSFDEIDRRFEAEGQPGEECIQMLARQLIDCRSIAEVRDALNRRAS